MQRLRPFAVLAVLSMIAGAAVAVFLAPPAAAAGLPSTGSLNVLVIRAYWGASPPGSPTDDQANAVVTDVRNWFTANAGTHLSLTLDMTTWLPISPPSTGCSADRAALLAVAKEAASSYNPDSYQGFVVALQGCPGETDAVWSTQGGEGVWLNGATGFTRGAIVNGLGHNMGLQTAVVEECPQGDQQGPCEEFDDAFSFTGDTFGFNASAPERSQLGWFTPGQVTDLTAGGVGVLSPLAIPGEAAVKFTAGARTYWLEWRSSARSRQDAELPSTATNGVLVHEVSSLRSGAAVLLNTDPIREEPDVWTIQPGEIWLTKEGFQISVTGNPNNFLSVNVTAPPKLTVSRAGSGSGTVTITPPGSVCPSTCTIPYYPGTSVTLAASPASGSTFSGWSGDCSGATCSLNMISDRNVTAVFASTAPVPIQESAVRLDGWSVVQNTGASGGSFRSSSTTGNTASFRFSGPAVTLVTRKGPQLGIARVTINGVNTNVDLFASTDQAFSVAFTRLGTGAHTITVRVNGTKNAASGGTAVVVDAFTVGTTTTQDSARMVTYGAWTGTNAAAASGGAYRAAPRANSTATLTFTGTAVDWVTATGPNRGRARVVIDGVSRGDFDQYAAAAHFQVVRAFTGLAVGQHTIQVLVLGTKRAASSGTSVPVDAFVVH